MSTSVWFPLICFVFVQAALPTNSSAQELQKLLSTVNATLNSMGSSLEEMNTKLMFQKQNNAVLKSTVESISSLVNSACTLNDCPENWSKYQGNCYEFSQCSDSSTCTSNNVKAACERQGASLASVGSKGENDFVSSLCDAEILYLFSGARDSETEGTWLWADGSNVTYTNWSAGQPNNKSNLDCAMTFVSTKNWFNDDCDYEFPTKNSGYVCEKQITSFCNNQR